MWRDRQFNSLCSRYSDDLFRFTLALLANRSDAEEATQDVLFKLWRQTGLIPLRNPRAWIFRTARNQCLDILRERARRQGKVTEAPDYLLEQPDDFQPHPSNGADAELLRRKLDSALGQLPEIQRSIFVLYEVNGLRYREIALVLDIPLNTTRVYLNRARENLQKTLTKESSWIRHYIS